MGHILITYMALLLCYIGSYHFKSLVFGDAIEKLESSGRELRAVGGSTLFEWHQKRAEMRAAKLTQLIGKIMLTNVPSPFAPTAKSPAHTTKGQAVFAVGMDETYMRKDARRFVTTLRNTGYTGDIVVAVDKNSQAAFIDTLHLNKCIVYVVEAECSGPETGHRVCSLRGEQSTAKFSINMIRYHLYRWWAMKYEEEATLLISDFRDVFFQSNPFEYRKGDIYGRYVHAPVHDLIVYQEAHPLKSIKRCVFNAGWVRNCYGADALKSIGHHPVSCSGVSMGTRNGILAYSYLMTQHLNPRMRYAKSLNSATKEQLTNDKCVTIGMDQGFHNFLLYSGVLDKFLRVKRYQQGEGQVNTIGAFYPGKRALIKKSLKEWGLLVGNEGDLYFTNWNGDPSPVIHQSDRFDDIDLKGAETRLRAFKNVFT